MDEDVTAGILFNHSFDDIDFFPTNSELRIKSVKYFKSFERVQNEVGKTHVDLPVMQDILSAIQMNGLGQDLEDVCSRNMYV